MFSAYDERVPWVVTLTLGFCLFELANVKLWGASSRSYVLRLLSIRNHRVAHRRALFRVAYVSLFVFISSELSTPLLQARWMAWMFRGKDIPVFGTITTLFGVPWAFFLALLRRARALGHEAVRTHPGISPWVTVLATATLPLPAMLNALWSGQIALTLDGHVQTEKLRRRGNVLTSIEYLAIRKLRIRI